MKFLKRHPIFNNTEDIQRLCRPLEKLNITYFCHVKINAQGDFSCLGNNPKFLEHYLANEYYNSDIHLTNIENLGHHILWDLIEVKARTARMNELAYENGLKHTFTIVKTRQDEKNFYHFSTLNKEIINKIYLNNYDLLEIFIRYFDEQLSNSTELKESYNFRHPIDYEFGSFSLANNMDDTQFKIKELLNFFNTSLPQQSEINSSLLRYKIASLLSRREIDVVSCLLQGKTAKETAENLFISDRTVETHLENIKVKCNCRTKLELISKLLNSKLEII